MKNYQGAVSLLMIALLTGVVSVLALSSLRLLIQSQHISHSRIDNHIREWNFLGISECVAAKVMRKPFSTDFSGCVDDGEISLEVSNGFSRHVVIKESEEQGSELELQLDLPQADRFGVIKSTMNLIFLNDLTVSPDPGKTAGENLWQCTSIIYKNSLYADSLSSSHPYLSPYFPYWGFTDDAAQCHASHYSIAATSSTAQGDFQQLSGLEPFFDLWHINISDWFTLMSSPHVGHVPTSLENVLDGTLLYHDETELPQPVFNGSCGSQIESQLLKGKRIIWVYGGCELNNDTIVNINHAIDFVFDRGGAIIVIQNGILSIHADTGLNALVMSVISNDSVDYLSQWATVSNLSEVTDEIIHQPYTVVDPALSLEFLAYYQSGMFYPKGGLVLIGSGMNALIKSGYFAFQKDIITEALALIRPVQRMEGSWREK